MFKKIFLTLTILALGLTACTTAPTQSPNSKEKPAREMSMRGLSKNV